MNKTERKSSKKFSRWRGNIEAYTYTIIAQQVTFVISVVQVKPVIQIQEAVNKRNPQKQIIMLWILLQILFNLYSDTITTNSNQCYKRFA